MSRAGVGRRPASRGRRPAGGRSWRLPWRLFVALIATLAALTQIAPLALGAVTREVPVPGGRVVEGVVGQPSSLNPLRLRNDVDRDLAVLLFNGLTRLAPSGEAEPDLASTWVRADDGLAYTFTIRADARWHDGRPVTAADAAFTVNRLAARQEPGPFAGLRAEAASPTSLRVTTPRPRPDLPQVMARPVAPAHRLAEVADADLDAAADTTAPVGSGPFRVVDASLDRLTLERNADYFGGRPFLERYVVRFFPDGAAARAAFGRGDVDALWLRAGANDPPAGRAFSVPVWSELTALAINTRAQPLADPALRRALYLAVAPATLANAAAGDRLAPATSPLPTPKAPGGLDLAGAAGSEFDRLGWTAGAGGTRARNGSALQLELLATESADSTELARLTADRLRAAGVDIVSTSLPWSRLASERLAASRFDLAVVGVRGAGDEAGLAGLWGGVAADGLNVSGLKSARLDAALDALRAPSGPAELAAARAALLAAWSDEMPAIPLAWPRYRFLAPPELQGVHLDSVLTGGQRYRDVQDWYIQTARAWKFGG